MKPKLLLHPDKWSNAVAHFLTPLYDEYVERVFIEPNKTYNPKECLVYSHCLDTSWVIPWRDAGFTVVIDNLWENLWPNLPEGVTVIRSDKWFMRANESIWYKSMGLDQYIRHPNISKNFLMFINRVDRHKDLIWGKIDLANSIYSYQGKGIKLNYNDADTTEGNWQRHFDPEWYNITNFSMVVESSVVQEELWHTEKTWKPVAFHHPFMLWAPAGYLNELHNQGFETFNHIIDESYDNEPVHTTRLAMILKQVNRLKDIKLIDPETIKRTDHNHNLFFNTEWSEQQFYQNLFSPILNLL